MTATTGPGPVGPATALPPLVDALVVAPLNGLDAGALQEQIAAVTPQVHRLQGWLQIAAGRLAKAPDRTPPISLPAWHWAGRSRSTRGAG